MKAKATLIIILSLFFDNSWAYELGTHARISQNAYLKSYLGMNNELFLELGLFPDDVIGGELSNGEISYYDVRGNQIRERVADNYSLADGRIPRLSNDNAEHIRKSVTPIGWLMRGAIREDDYITLFGADNPQDDPDGNFVRPYHHFFDPVNNLPLNGVSTFFRGGVVHTAPAWALGTTNTDAFSNPIVPEGSRRNHFTVLDAREVMYRALTGLDKAGNKTIGPGNRDAIEADRKAYWATTFRALGDVVHLIQDMAQPQHTRNDPHSPVNSDAQQVYEEQRKCQAWLMGLF